MPRVIKETYQQALNKKAVQKDIFSSVDGKYKYLIGLAGPDINSYLALVKSFGIKEAAIYENNNMQLLRQIAQFHNILPTQVFFSDIMRAKPLQKETLYDLDFCFSVLKGEEYIKKFKKDSTITTLSMRPLNFENTIKKYLKALFGVSRYDVEDILETENFIKQMLHTTKGSVCHYRYRDTSPMLVFTNFK
jgi:DNA-binding phage protein